MRRLPSEGLLGVRAGGGLVDGEDRAEGAEGFVRECSDWHPEPPSNDGHDRAGDCPARQRWFPSRGRGSQHERCEGGAL